MKAKCHVLPLAFVCVLVITCMAHAANAQLSSGTIVSVVPQQNTANAGERLILNITVSNVQNLYGLDVLLDWNASVLKIDNISSQLGVESHPGGVLHETPSAPIVIVENNASQSIGEYHLVATSQGVADSFNGSGTIATLTFTMITTGQTELNLTSQLADHPIPDETVSELIPHTDVNGSVNVVIPEFPQLTLLAPLIGFVTTALLLSKKLLKRHKQ